MNENEMLSRRWRGLTFVAFDTETTGKYPLSAEICELAGVKWRDGEVVETFQTLLKPSKPMDAEVIAIHGITNEMVQNAPLLKDRINEFHGFIKDTVCIAHHAPFDLGFVAHEFEKAGLDLPVAPALCSSLLSRKLFPESENHRLQTLIKFFDLEQGAAHRALDDARACLQVALRCMEKVGDRLLLEVAGNQGGPILWSRFSMRELERKPHFKKLMDAVNQQKVVEMVYGSGSKPGEKRRVHPLGLVRSLDGDFLVAYAENEQRSKRYFLDKVLDVAIVS